mgnify:CR=1 FL=1
MKTSDLMIYDSIADEYGFPMYVTAVGVDYVYATFEGGPEDDENEYTDKDFAEGNARPIELTPDMLLANGFTQENGKYNLTIQETTYLRIEDMGRLFALNACGEIRRFRVRYVHELQHILRSMDLSEFADDFKIKPTLSK